MWEYIRMVTISKMYGKKRALLPSTSSLFSRMRLSPNSIINPSELGGIRYKMHIPPPSHGSATFNTLTTSGYVGRPKQLHDVQNVWEKRALLPCISSFRKVIVTETENKYRSDRAVISFSQHYFWQISHSHYTCYQPSGHSYP